MSGVKSNTGAQLRKQHKIPAIQVRYHWKGDFFMPLERFPGALADMHGYVIFPDEETYLADPNLDHRGGGKNPRLGVPDGISKLKTYIKF